MKNAANIPEPWQVVDVKKVTQYDTASLVWWLVADMNGGFEWRPFIVDIKDETRVLEAPAWSPLPGSQFIFLSCPIWEAMYGGNRGPGKRIKNSSLVLTDSGWKAAGSVTLSDMLVAPDGTYTRLKAVHPSNHGNLYRFTFCDGATIDADDDHLWAVRSVDRGYRDGWEVKSTKELRSLKGGYAIPLMSGPAPGDLWTKNADPYVVGLLIGDGTMTGHYPTLYVGDDDYDFMAPFMRGLGWKEHRQPGRRVCMFQATNKTTYSPYTEVLHERRVGDKKRVPESLLTADPATRLAVLQGLMDSDGSIDVPHTDRLDCRGFPVTGGRCEFKSVSEQLAKDVQYLVRSLGGKATVTKKPRSEKDQASRGGRDHIFKVSVMHCNKFNPFRIPRKAERVKKMKGVHRTIKSIVKVEDGAATCFEVEHPSHLFVCQDFIVTHNSLTLLFDFAKDIGHHGESWRGILFRLEFGDLDDIVRKIEEWYYRIFPGFRFLRSKSEYVAEWPGGERLLLRNLPNADAYSEYHGHEYPWMGFEELTQWPDDVPYKLMQSCSRPTAQGVPTRIRSTTNPDGPGHRWVKKRFQLPHMYGKVVRVPGEMPRVAIQGALSENFLLLTNDPNYPTKIKNAARNLAQAEAWLAGSWDITSGGMVDDLWDAKVHIIPSFKASEVPRGWLWSRSYDHGSSRPFCHLWWLESNGEPLHLPNGRVVGEVKGDLVLFAEWYGTTGNDNEGLRMTARDIGRGIMDRQKDMGIRKRVLFGPADSAIFNKDENRNDSSIASDMEAEGVVFEKADKSPGSRIRGAEVFRERLEGSKQVAGMRDRRGIFICDRCKYWIDLVPPMPRSTVNPDDVPETYEDHPWDSTRYRLLWEQSLSSSSAF